MGAFASRWVEESFLIPSFQAPRGAPVFSTAYAFMDSAPTLVSSASPSSSSGTSREEAIMQLSTKTGGEGSALLLMYDVVTYSGHCQVSAPGSLS